MSIRPLLLSALLLIACQPSDEDPVAPAGPIRELPRQLTGTEQSVVAGSNAFTFELLQRVASSDTAGNIVLSPLSASFALGMLLNGAAGGTWEEMRATLGFAGLSQAEINAGYAGLVDLLMELDPAVRFRIANSVWSREGFPFVPAFGDTVRHYFDAETRALDFGDPASVDVINSWVADATEGRIDEILDHISPDQLMFLINAIYFKGDWARPFDPRNTGKGSFTLRSGSTAEVDMMSEPKVPQLFADLADGTKVLELTYGGEAFSTVFVLPPDGADAFEVAATLEPAQWDAWIAALDTVEEVTVRMPKYELEYERTLNDDLIALGMGSAFAPGAADFSRLASGVYVDLVKQKTFLKVDEIGTEAAAVTLVAIAESLGPHIFLDRPFLFAIRERLTGTIVFIGVIGDPS